MNRLISPLKERAGRIINYALPYLLRRAYGRFTQYEHPDFLIIGTQRGGTTSLFRYLMQLPMFKEPLLKEIHYFDLNYDKSLDWYYSHFPQNIKSIGLLTGEASPYYLFHPDVPSRVANISPHIKLIILLRNPLTRAISHYYHSVQLGVEKRTFADAVKHEIAQIESNKNSPQPNTLAHREQSYVARGIYVPQLRQWYSHFPAEQFLMLNSEQFFDNPRTTLQQVLYFLGLQDTEITISKFIPHNRSVPHLSVSSDTCEQLSNFYLPYNIQLAQDYNFDVKDWHE